MRVTNMHLPGSIDKDNEDCWVTLHKGCEDLTVLKASCTQLLKQKFGLPDSTEFVVDSDYRWKPMPDGEEDEDGYNTMQWAELYDPYNKDLSTKTSFLFWNEFEKRYCSKRDLSDK